MSYWHLRRAVGAVGIIALLVSAEPSTATTILSISGDISVDTTIPASLLREATESDAMVVYLEKEDVVLTSDVYVNFASAGPYTPALVDPTPTIPIAAGTTLSSFLFHLDPVGNPSTPVTIAANVTFDADILGVIATHTSLTATDSILGVATTSYDTWLYRGMEPPGSLGDSINISTDLRTLTLRFAATQLDEIRVLVAPSNNVPEPSIATLLGVGLVGLGVMRRKKLAA